MTDHVFLITVLLISLALNIAFVWALEKFKKALDERRGLCEKAKAASAEWKAMATKWKNMAAERGAVLEAIAEAQANGDKYSVTVEERVIH